MKIEIKMGELRNSWCYIGAKIWRMLHFAGRRERMLIGHHSTLCINSFQVSVSSVYEEKKEEEEEEEKGEKKNTLGYLFKYCIQTKEN